MIYYLLLVITYYNHIHDTHSHIDVNTEQFNDDDTEPFEYSTIDTFT